MTNDEINATLARIFPGDPVPDVTEDTHWSDEPGSAEVAPVSWRVSAPPTKRRVESPRVKARSAIERTSRLVEHRTLPPLSPTTPSVPTRPYLLEAPGNVAHWLEEAREIESDAKLGQPVEPHQATRLLLEAIPVVESWQKRG